MGAKNDAKTGQGSGAFNPATLVQIQVGAVMRRGYI